MPSLMSLHASYLLTPLPPPLALANDARTHPPNHTPTHPHTCTYCGHFTHNVAEYSHTKTTLQHIIVQTKCQWHFVDCLFVVDYLDIYSGTMYACVRALVVCVWVNLYACACVYVARWCVCVSGVRTYGRAMLVHAWTMCVCVWCACARVCVCMCALGQSHSQHAGHHRTGYRSGLPSTSHSVSHYRRLAYLGGSLLLLHYPLHNWFWWLHYRWVSFCFLCQCFDLNVWTWHLVDFILFCFLSFLFISSAFKSESVLAEQRLAPTTNTVKVGRPGFRSLLGQAVPSLHVACVCRAGCFAVI